MAHGHIRGSIERVSAASAICEVARLTCFADAEDPFL
jgi:DNA repair protein RecO (recombination protein O)